MAIKINLPLAPSVNGLYANAKRGGRFKTKAYRDWLKAADAMLLLQCRDWHGRQVRGPARVHIRVPMKMRGDVDNRAKAPVDFLVSRELTSDDHHNHKVTVERCAEVLPQFCVVTIEPVGVE